MIHCLDNTTSKSDANVDSQVIMDEIETEKKIKELVNMWDLQDDLSEKNKFIIDSLVIIDSLKAFKSPEKKNRRRTGARIANQEMQSFTRI